MEQNCKQHGIPTEEESAAIKMAFKRHFSSHGVESELPHELAAVKVANPVEWAEACLEFAAYGSPFETGSLVKSRGNIADDVLAAYDFGEGVTVVEQDNWNTDDPNDYTKIVYVEYVDEKPEGDSHKVSFHVRFNPDGSIDDAYALEMDGGNDIGHRGDSGATYRNLAETRLSLKDEGAVEEMTRMGFGL